MSDWTARTQRSGMMLMFGSAFEDQAASVGLMMGVGEPASMHTYGCTMEANDIDARTCGRWAAMCLEELTWLHGPMVWRAPEHAEDGWEDLGPILGFRLSRKDSVLCCATLAGVATDPRATDRSERLGMAGAMRLLARHAVLRLMTRYREGETVTLELARREQVHGLPDGFEVSLTVQATVWRTAARNPPPGMLDVVRGAEA